MAKAAAKESGMNPARSSILHMSALAMAMLALAQPVQAANKSDAEYCVIDVSAGPKALKYQVSHLDKIPDGGWTDAYRTDKIVLRRIEPGKFKMQNDGETSISKAFYIGVFEITQRQYELVTGERPGAYRNAPAALRPVEQVSYEMIRGGKDGAKWPESGTVDADSFLGRLRAKTGLGGLDLPTEAQWEYSCRAGTSTPYYWGEKIDPSYAVSYEQDRFPRVVGKTKPNAWGLYDMCGNVWEWCRDWYGSGLSFGKDPAGPAKGERRVMRGGCWRTDRFFCTSYRRTLEFPWNFDLDIGFRISCDID